MKWLKPAEAAAILQTTAVKVNEMCDSGTFRPEHLYKLGKEWRISPAAFEPPTTPVVVEDEVTLARIAKGLDALQDELDRLRKIAQKPAIMERRA